MFGRKRDFRPDKNHSGALSKLYITKKQRRTLLKWLLMALVLIALSVVQDVILSRVRLFGAATDLVPAAILTVCIMLDPEVGSVFVLVASSLYWFSGSAPGPYVIVVMTVLGVVIGILRQSFLRYGFLTVMLCAAAAVMLYELTVFGIGFFLGFTTLSRLGSFCLSGALSLAVMPLLYPVFAAIRKMGGETWTE
ncbi:MAG: hypothetical protein PUB93_03025 [Firmicutes bacterium]|nr:hypothetical protein [Bacillota bacterium]